MTANAKRPHVKQGNKVFIKGTATPAGPGAKVTLELKVEERHVEGRSRPRTSPRPAPTTSRPRRRKAGNAKYRVMVSETNTTGAATSNKVKVLVVKK